MRLRCAGFTLIEMLVVVTVIGTVLAYGLPSYSSFSQNGQIRNTAESIVDGLNIARMEAVNRNERIEFNLNGAGWTIDVPSTGERVQVQSAAGASKVAVIAQNADRMTVSFNGLGRITSGNASTAITVGSSSAACMPSGSARCLRVQLATSGRIRMCDPSLASDDPQACA